MVKILNVKKHTDQRMRLLSHARRLFASGGVKETSMSQIAKACKVTKATLYHYFKNKEAILQEILDCRSREIDTLMVKLNQARDLEECFYALAQNHLRQMEEPENLEIMKILLSETMKNNDMKKFYMAFTNENIQKGAKDILGPMVKGRKTEKEVRLLFFQFLATLMHYTWHMKMVGDISGTIGGDEAFARQLAKTYASAFQ
jgi:AcrR family transcriptional regulator